MMRSPCLYEEFPALDVVLHAQPEEVTEDGFCVGVPLDDAILIKEYHVSCNAADLNSHHSQHGQSVLA